MDCIFLSDIAFNISSNDIITKIKQQYPLTEIILVAYSQNYATAISALRLGVRDILTEPYEKSVLNNTLNKVVQHRNLFKP